MNELAHYSFIPWLRQGLATRIPERDLLGDTPGEELSDERASLKVEIKLEEFDKEGEGSTESTILKSVELVGPGDITGLKPSVVMRTQPRRNISNFEANNLAYIEFYEEDFPWRYTPVNAGGRGISVRRLRPWLALIVLKEDEFALQAAKEGLSSIQIFQDSANDVFHLHTEHWAWAHVQLNYKTAHTSGNNLINEIKGTLEDNPDMGLSRLLCPRKLTPNTAYTAFLIPAFETGRLAGLGESISGIKAQESSWNKGNMPHSNTRPSEYPIYYHWEFKTGNAGDFESLVSLLVPTITAADLGQRPMLIDDPGYGLDRTNPDSPTLGMEGALRPTNFAAEAWPGTKTDNPGNNAYVEKLRELINLSTDILEGTNNAAQNNNPFYSSAIQMGDDPIITPPLYGQWHALIQRLGQSGAPAWIQSLNEDPRNRAAAGLGTQIVQKYQENLMNQAWQQIGEVNEANQQIREAELSKMAGIALFAKHVAQQDADRFLSLTSSMHKRVLDQDENLSLEHSFKSTRLPIAAKSAAFKRIVRPGKKANKKLNTVASGSKLHQNIVSNFNKDLGAITTATLKAIPLISLEVGTVVSAINQAIQDYEANDNSMAKETFVKIIEDSNLAVIDKTIWQQALNALGLRAGINTIVTRLIDNVVDYGRSPEGYLDVFIEPAVYTDIYGEASNLKTSQNGVIRVRRELQTDESLKSEGSATLSEITSFQALFQDFSDNSTGLLQRPQLKDQISSNRLDNIHLNLKQAFNPRYSVLKRVNHRIKLFTSEGSRPIEQIKPIMAHPNFPQPAYEWLSELSQDYILPNVASMPNNSITILETNPTFIEAYLAGLNHEMSRELLWREYPTDQRGTYFRQFWDIKDNLFERNDELKRDIQKMHEWNKDLGEHPSRPGDSSYLVLVIRGELFLKYPNTMVYAQKAQYGSPQETAPRELSLFSTENVKFPLFQAQLEPDIYLFGFQLSAEDARGHRGDTDPASISGPLNPGWFIVFKERPGQVSFGFDDFTGPLGETNAMPAVRNPESWNDMAWEYLVEEKPELLEYQINFSRSITPSNPPQGQANPRWNNNAADMASILYQNPFLLARHTHELLPKGKL